MKNKGSTSSSQKIWTNTIENIVSAKELPSNFRKFRGFVKIVEGNHKYSGYENFYYLKKKFSKKEMEIFNYEKIYPGPHKINIKGFKTNPTILRYIRNVHNIELLFSKEIFKNNIFD